LKPAPFPSFPGFPEAGIAFLRGLEKHNRREWFQPRKEIFDTQVKAPMAVLVEEINRGLARFAADYITDPADAIYRIYRDTRFSSDKTPYKTHIAALFRKRGFDKHAAASLYLSVSHKELEVAGGVYMPGPGQLIAIRRHIEERHVEFRKIATAKRLVSIMGELHGDALKRVPKGFSCDHPAEDLIRKKQWLYYVVLEPAIALTPKVTGEVLERFKLMMPVIEFLNTPLGPRRASEFAHNEHARRDRVR
jgi:uncharacterized protein (TIGR02453 family)